MAVSTGLSMFNPPIRVGREKRLRSLEDISERKIVGNSCSVMMVSIGSKKEPHSGITLCKYVH